VPRLLAVLLMDDKIKSGFTAAQDIIKQLITIATAVIGATVIFSGSGSSALLTFKTSGLAAPIALGFLLASIGAGLCALMNIVGALGNPDIQSPTPYQWGIRLFTMIQAGAFALGMGVMAIFVPHWII
jgi:hypothetical protein